MEQEILADQINRIGEQEIKQHGESLKTRETNSCSNTSASEVTRLLFERPRNHIYILSMVRFILYFNR
jgi:hypothetical protein